MNKIIHTRSSAVLENGNPKLPAADRIEYGELAINFADGVETISLKNKSNEIVEFKTKEYFEKIISDNQELNQSAIDDINNQIVAIQETVEENELITATALTDLDERMLLVEKVDYDQFATKAELDGYTTDTEFTTLSNDVDILKEERMKVQTLTSSTPTISTLEENTYYICTSAVSRLTMTNFQNNTGKPVAHYKVFFKISSTSPTITFPSGITWAHGEVPIINDTSFSYEVDIEKITYNNTTSYRGILVKFK